MSLVLELKRDYGDFSIDIPRWEILDAGITALWGPSGAGKTSVFRLLLGLEPCPTLKWEFQGEDLACIATPARRLGVVLQTLELFPHMTAEENIRFAAEARRIPFTEARGVFDELVDLLNLKPFLGRRAALLSGGEKQRVALARALIGRPRVLFLDEPFSALDADLRAEARQLVKRVVQTQKIPTVLITHDRQDLEVLADKMTEIRAGRIVAGG